MDKIPDPVEREAVLMTLKTKHEIKLQHPEASSEANVIN
jgi:hypothetical protein